MPKHIVKSYIYCLVDPIINMPIYVGCTKRPVSRLDSHIHNSINKRGSKKLDAAIGDILSDSKYPYMEVLEECNPEDADQREKLWIKRFRAWGIPILNVEFSGNLIDKRRIFVKRDSMINITHEEVAVVLSSHQKGDWAEIGDMCGCSGETIRNSIKTKRINKTVWAVVCDYFKMKQVA